MKDNKTTDELNNQDVFANLFIDSNPPNLTDTDEALEVPKLNINLEDIDEKTRNRATLIAEKLSAYYFDPKYVEKHPYIENKIYQEIDNIRRLLKMLVVNEKAQDTLITSIVISSSKGTLYGSLTSLQNSMLSMQSQLNQLTSNLENIFREMQEDCEQSFESKDKENSPDGTVIVRGSRDFIMEMTERINKSKKKKENEQENKQENIQEVI